METSSLAFDPGPEVQVGHQFFVEGVRCSSCLNKIQTLCKTHPSIQSYHFDMSRNVLDITIADNRYLSGFTKSLREKGFQAYPIENGEQSETKQIRADRMALARLGVAGFSAGNIMLMAVAVYAGAEGIEAQFMHYVGALLALPALTFSAWPLYHNAFAELRNKKISVDLPIVLALLAGAVLSILAIWRGSGDIYFDSMTALVFLILGSRYLLARVQRRYLGPGRIRSLFQVHSARLLKNGQEVSVPVQQVSAGQDIRVLTGEIVPLDGELSSIMGSFQNALLTGEIRPVSLAKGAKVFMGMVNLGEPVTVSVAVPFADSRLQKILRQVEAAVLEKPKSVRILDQAGQGFLLVVLLAALGLVLAFASTNPTEGIQRALALVLVTCPCTFAFAAPLVFSLGLSKAASLGFLIKHPNIFEHLRQIKNVIFDKTGTLTDGLYEVKEFSAAEGKLQNQDLRAILALASASEHPVSQSIRRYLLKQNLRPLRTVVENLSEKPTVGLFGTVGKDHYILSSRAIYKNGKRLVEVHMGDSLRNEAGPAVRELAQDYKIFVLSGDEAANVQKVAKQIGVSSACVVPKASPEQKTAFVEQHNPALMVGDGANDSLALAKAHVSVAVRGSLESSLRAADVYLAEDSLHLIGRLLNLAKKIQFTMTMNLVIAIIYNLTAATLAATGYIHPLLAAILMPMSSLTQLISSLQVLKGEAK